MGEGKKRKGLGGLTPEKKKLLKQLIMQKAAEDMKKKNAEEAEAKKKIVEARMKPLQIDGMSEGDLKKKVNELYKLVCSLEKEKYDWEVKIRTQEYEINELTIKVNDIKGKFVKPVLKKVAKSESKLAKFDKSKKKSGAFRDTLKSSGKSKYALEEPEEPTKKPDFGQDALHKKEEAPKEEEAEAPAEEEAEEEEEEEEE